MLCFNWKEAAFEALYESACAALAQEAGSSAAKRFFRRAMPHYTSEPESRPGENACYITIGPQDGAVDSPEYSYGDGEIIMTRQLAAECLFTCVGPSAFGHAEALRLGLCRDSGILHEGKEYDNPRDILRRQGISPAAHQPPVRVQTGIAKGSWQEKAEFLFKFTVTLTIRHAAPMLAHVPRIETKKE